MRKTITFADDVAAAVARLQRKRGRRVSDAHLAALAIEHGTGIWSTDSDFARFPGLP
jgi:predicted nucleic acid-binding protein